MPNELPDQQTQLHTLALQCTGHLPYAESAADGMRAALQVAARSADDVRPCCESGEAEGDEEAERVGEREDSWFMCLTGPT